MQFSDSKIEGILYLPGSHNPIEEEKQKILGCDTQQV